MQENMDKLMALAAKDKKLSEKLQKADKKQIIALAKEQGITLTEADFETPKGKVSDEELAAVAGGGYCFCAMGGGGTAEEGAKACACVIAGMGYDAGGTARCSCVIAGQGD